ncbi:glycosyl transferase [Vibrio sp. 10N.286.49.C2]|uniref:glycosyltransferase n=1 Tax=unclassified Vibrio TaxID=2614977 RepID=UPI000C823F7C|nr:MULTISPECIES: glycosyltransferase [unclassified Vibrio]PMH34505.1 glycosyl transferase [Vibrio sp. 10N.286.49.C2]PMH46990.1 glycosyl transferase [Vibrio sp. 10N.286.49.B1]
MYSASIIIAFYNNLDVLSVVLKALEHQTESNFEVIIADDGSRDDVVKKLNRVIEASPLAIQHIWHEDAGFRKNRCLNLCVKASRSEYLIFIDGDCVPQSHFIEDHLSESRVNRVINGRRADLSPRCSELLVTCSSPEQFVADNFGKMVIDGLRGKGKNVEKGYRLTNDWLRAKLQNKKKGLVGCNLSLHKADLLKINGFDMRYEAAGTGEDSDIDFRLQLLGVEIHNCFYKATQVHIYHKELPRLPVNDELFAKVRAEKIAYTAFGIDTLPS